MKKAWVLVALAGIAGSAVASSNSSTTLASVSFSNKASRDAQGTVTNDTATWVATGGGTVNAIRVTGQLTEVATTTWASEARVRISPGAGQAFTAVNVQATTVQDYVGTIAIGPTVLTGPAFTLNNGGTVNFEWFESFQDGTAGLPESIWDNVTYDFLSNTVIDGGGSLGALANDGSTLALTNQQQVSGGLDFFTFTIGGVGNLGSFLNIQSRTPAGGTGMDLEIALYDSNGNFVATDDDGQVSAFGGTHSMLSFGADDPLFNAETPAGIDGLTLAAGTYTLVVGGFNTTFGATINDITRGTASGFYDLQITYAPTPGALAVLGLAGFAAARRRRA